MIDLGDTEAVLREYDAQRLMDAATTGLRGHRGHLTAPGQPEAPGQWEAWLRTLFPAYVVHPFGGHHGEFWGHVWAVGHDTAPRPIVPIWPRGGAKSTSAELATCALGVMGRRRYALYACSTQDSADKHVATVASLLESQNVARFYPAHADRALSKFGHSRGWRRNRLVTSGGFVVDAAGLDTAVRGLKFEEQRPDLIILDDLDEEHDSPATTAKKIRTLTKAILPAGSTNVAVIAIQNLIIADGIFTRLADGRADYLAERIVLGPYPAIQGLETELREDPETGTRKAMIVKGSPTWAGQGLAECQHLMDTIGLVAFLKECQHEVAEHIEGRVLKNLTDDALEDLSHDQAVAVCKLGQCFGGIDFGDWRFGFVLRAADTGGVCHQIAELFSQREDASTRAKRMDDVMRDTYQVPYSVRIWGDNANQQDIREINVALRRIAIAKGTERRRKLLPYTVVPVGMENKLRRASVDRMNDLLLRGALKYRRGVMAEMAARLNEPALRHWKLGWNVAQAGVETEGSRLWWEAKHWSYAVPVEGKAQDQDPDDHTADGADLIAADRYALMSWWRAAKKPAEKPKVNPNQDRTLGRLIESLTTDAARSHDPFHGRR